MSEQSALLRAIRDDPPDDGVRLVYADWLDENDQPDRAAFIRAQIHGDRERAAALLERFGEAFLADVPEWARERAVFERGFVAEVRIDGRHWAASAADLVRTIPLERLRLWNLDRQLNKLADRAELRRLRLLDLSMNGVARIGAENLARCPHLSRLEYLDLSNNNLRDEGVAALSVAGHLGALHTLDIAYNSVIGAVPRLVTSPALPNLRRLRLGGNFLGDRGAIDLARTPQLTRLETLDLSGSGLRERGAEALASSAFVTGLRELDLSRNSIRDAGAIALARSRHLAGLEALTLWDCDIENAGTAALRGRFGDRVLL